MCVTQLVQIVVFLCLSTLGVLCSQRDLRIIRPPRNQTVMMERRLKLFCKTWKPDEVSIKWYHNGEQMPIQGKFYEITGSGSVLRFTKIQVVDRGKYRCRVENDLKEVEESETAFLFVHAPVVIMNKIHVRKVRKLPIGYKISIECKAAGIPAPVIEWRKNGQPLFVSGEEWPDLKRKDYNTSDVSMTSHLKITVMETAVYTCFAVNMPIAGIRNDSFDIKIIAVHPPSNDMQTEKIAVQTPKHVCAPYKGAFCKEFLQGRLVHHDNFDASNGLGDMEQLLTNLWQEVEDMGLFKSLTNNIREGFCQAPAKRMLCHLAFPDCDNHTSQPLNICRESCEAVKTLFCFRPWAELEEMKLKGNFLKNKGNLSLPDCPNLPSKWNTSQSCIESDHHEYSPSKVSDTCYVENGRWYNGSVNVTVSGRLCQAWHVNFPQQHDRTPLIFPELAGAENFCRNPGAEEDQPWCYTTDTHVRWEKCSVIPCSMPLDSRKNEKKPVEKEQEIDVFILVIAVTCVACVIVLIAVPIFIYRRCTGLRYNATPQYDTEIDISNVPINSAYHQVKSNRLDPKLETLEFPRNDIEYIRDLGQGAFGRVFQARLICSNGNSRITGGKLSMSGSKYSLNCDKQCKHPKANTSSGKGDFSTLHNDCNSSLLSPRFTSPSHGDREEAILGEQNGQLIAVKMLKEDASDAVQADFEREASLMVNFDHPNIVRLLGVCTLGKPMCLLFEFMSKGDLNDFLRQCSLDRCLIPSNKDSLPRRETSRTKIDLVDQLSIAHQIASGMAYLSDHGYVHRDLATRNCLVGCGLIVKISDFGLARSVHSMNYYHGSDKDAIPIRWMPPEAILYNKFSSLSDVWSFGVLLWEIFSYALQPYYGMTHEEVINYLCDDKVLACPDNTPAAVYELMKSCWKRKPKERPNFSFLHRSLSVMCEDSKKPVTQNLTV